MSKRRVNVGLAEAALLFGALGNEMRLALLRRLAEAGPASISSLSQGSQVSRQAITKHLNLLASAGLVDDIHAGREHLWSLNASRLAEAQRCLDIIARSWDDALHRLKTHLEQD